MSPVSAGLLLYRGAGADLEVFLVHPGGPFWARKDDGAWSLPKGLVESGEAPLDAALREWTEETGLPVPTSTPLSLGEVRLKSRKRVLAWACEGDCDPDALVSETFEMEWPPRSGTRATFPEVDRGAWFDVPTARVKLNVGQVVLVDRLVQALADG